MKSIKKRLESAGISVVNNQIAKSDLQKAQMVVAELDEVIEVLEEMGMKSIELHIPSEFYKSKFNDGSFGDSYEALPWEKFNGKYLYVDIREDILVLQKEARKIVKAGYKIGALEFDEGSSAFFKSESDVKNFLAEVKKLSLANPQ